MNKATFKVAIDKADFEFVERHFPAIRKAIDHVKHGGVFEYVTDGKKPNRSQKRLRNPALILVQRGYRYRVTGKDIDRFDEALSKAEAGEDAEFGKGIRLISSEVTNVWTERL